MARDRSRQRQQTKPASGVLRARTEVQWDRQIIADFEKGKLGRFIRRAKREARQGRLQKFP